MDGLATLVYSTVPSPYRCYQYRGRDYYTIMEPTERRGDAAFVPADLVIETAVPLAHIYETV